MALIDQGGGGGNPADVLEELKRRLQRYQEITQRYLPSSPNIPSSSPVPNPLNIPTYDPGPGTPLDLQGPSIPDPTLPIGNGDTVGSPVPPIPTESAPLDLNPPDNIPQEFLPGGFVDRAARGEAYPWIREGLDGSPTIEEFKQRYNEIWSKNYPSPYIIPKPREPAAPTANRLPEYPKEFAERAGEPGIPTKEEFLTNPDKYLWYGNRKFKPVNESEKPDTQEGSLLSQAPVPPGTVRKILKTGLEEGLVNPVLTMLAASNIPFSLLSEVDLNNLLDTNIFPEGTTPAALLRAGYESTKEMFQEGQKPVEGPVTFDQAMGDASQRLVYDLPEFFQRNLTEILKPLAFDPELASPEERAAVRTAMLNTVSGAEAIEATKNDILYQDEQAARALYAAGVYTAKAETAADPAIAEAYKVAAADAGRKAIELQNRTPTDIRDEHANIWAELGFGLLFDPLNLVEFGLGKERILRKGRRLAEMTPEAAEALLRQADNIVREGAPDLFRVSRNPIKRFFGLTPSSQAQVAANNSYTALAIALRNAQTTDDARLILQLIKENPGSLFSGFEGLTDLSVSLFTKTQDGKYIVSPVAANFLDAKSLKILQDSADTLLKMDVLAPGRVLSSAEKVELFGAIRPAFEDGARRAFGVSAAQELTDIPIGVTSIQAEGNKVVMRAADGTVVQEVQAVSRKDAVKAAQEANRKTRQYRQQNPVMSTLSFVKGLMSDIYLGFNPSFWVRNSLSAAGHAMMDEAFTLVPTRHIDDWMDKMYRGAVTPRFDEGVGNIASEVVTEGGGLFNRIRQKVHNVWTGNTYVPGWILDLPVGEQNWFKRIFYKVNRKEFERGFKQVAQESAVNDLINMGVNPDRAKLIADMVVDNALVDGKEGLFKVVDDLAQGTPSFSPSTFGLDVEDLSPESWRTVRDFYQGLANGTTSPEDFPSVLDAVRKSELERFGHIISDAPEPPYRQFSTQADMVDDLADIRGTLVEAGRRAGNPNAAQEAQQTVQQIAQRQEAIQQELQGFITDVADTSPEARKAILLAHKEVTDTLNRARIEQSRLAEQAMRTQNWSEYFAQVNDLYSNAYDEALQAVQSARQRVASGEIPSFDEVGWDLVQQSMDTDLQQLERLRGQEVTGPLTDPSVQQQMGEVIQANRQFVDYHNNRLWQTALLDPGTESLDTVQSVVRTQRRLASQAVAQRDAELQRFLAGEISVEQYRASRNRIWRDLADAQSAVSSAGTSYIVENTASQAVMSNLTWTDENFIYNVAGKQLDEPVQLRLVSKIDDSKDLFVVMDESGGRHVVQGQYIPAEVKQQFRHLHQDIQEVAESLEAVTRDDRVYPTLTDFLDQNVLPDMKNTVVRTLDGQTGIIEDVVPTTSGEYEAIVRVGDKTVRAPAGTFQVTDQVLPTDLDSLFRFSLDQGVDLEQYVRARYQKTLNELTADEIKQIGQDLLPKKDFDPGVAYSHIYQATRQREAVSQTVDLISQDYAKAAEGLSVPSFTEMVETYVRTGQLPASEDLTRLAQRLYDSGASVDDLERFVQNAAKKYQRLQALDNATKYYSQLVDVKPEKAAKKLFPDFKKMNRRQLLREYGSVVEEMLGFSQQELRRMGQTQLRDLSRAAWEMKYALRGFAPDILTNPSVRKMLGIGAEEDLRQIFKTVSDVQNRMRHRPATISDIATFGAERADRAVQKILNNYDRVLGSFNVNPEETQLIRRWVETKGSLIYDNVLEAAAQTAYNVANFSLLDYGKRRGFDTALGYFAPFTYWGTRSIRNNMERIFNKPAILSQYVRFMNALNKAGDVENKPARLENKVNIPGTEYWVPNPALMFFPFSDIFPRESFDRPKPGDSLLDKAMLGAQTLGLTPYPMWNIMWKVLRGEKQQIRPMIPQDSVLRYTLAAMGIQNPLTPEVTARKAAGVGDSAGGDYWDAYRVARKAAEMEEAGILPPGYGRWVQEYTLVQLGDKDPLPEMPADVEKWYQQVYQAAMKDTAIQQATKFFTGFGIYRYSNEEEALRGQAQTYRERKYDVQENPFGSRAASQATITDPLKAWWGRSSFFPGNENQPSPGVRASYDELKKAEEALYKRYQQEVANLYRENPKAGYQEEQEIWQQYRQEKEVLESQYPSAAQMTFPDTPRDSGMSPVEVGYERANRLLRFAQDFPGRPEAPVGGTPEEWRQYYKELEAWKQQAQEFVQQQTESQGIRQEMRRAAYGGYPGYGDPTFGLGITDGSGLSVTDAGTFSLPVGPITDEEVTKATENYRTRNYPDEKKAAKEQQERERKARETSQASLKTELQNYPWNASAQEKAKYLCGHPTLANYWKSKYGNAWWEGYCSGKRGKRQYRSFGGSSQAGKLVNRIQIQSRGLSSSLRLPSPRPYQAPRSVFRPDRLPDIVRGWRPR